MIMTQQGILQIHVTNGIFSLPKSGTFLYNQVDTVNLISEDNIEVVYNQLF